MGDGIGNTHVSDKFIPLKIFQAGFKNVESGLGEFVRKYIGDITGKAKEVELGVIVVVLLLGGKHLFDQG